MAYSLLGGWSPWKAGPETVSGPASGRVSDDRRAAVPPRHDATQATVRVADIGATHVAAELARGAGWAVAAAGLGEQGGGDQAAGRLGLPARQSGQELRGRRVDHRGRGGRWRLGHGLGDREEGEEGQEDENGLLHRFISFVDGTGGRPIRLQRKECPAGLYAGRAGPEAACGPALGKALDGPRAAGPRDAVIANAGVIVWGRRATGETAELARPAREAVGVVGHEQGRWSQV